jgi:DNA-binding LytR/AlgR family response regulator
MKCIAIDDEPVALTIIRKYCDKMGDMELDTYTNPHIGLQKIIEERPDIVFLDIEMNGMTGMEIARQLPPNICLIFTTAYADYALEGFEVNAVDFLHKPFFYPRFIKAVNKAKEWIKMKHVSKMTQRPERLITLKVEYKNVAISIDSIVYVESMDNYVKIHRTDKSTLISQISLKKLEEMLPSKEFVRVHRSYVISLNKVEHYTKQSIKLIGYDDEIPVGRFYGIQIAEYLKDKLKMMTKLPDFFEHNKDRD